MTAVVVFDNVDIIFGDKPERALAMVDQGKTRDEIGAETGLVLGVADASLTIQEGEILVLMGLSGSGKSTLLRAVNGLAPVVRGEVSGRNAERALSIPTRPARQGAARPAHAHRLDGVPAVRAPALAHGCRQCRLRPGACGHAGSRAQEARRRTARARQPDEMGRPQGQRALRRHAAARRPCPRLCHRRADPADGRAVLGARSADPHAPAGRACWNSSGA